MTSFSLMENIRISLKNLLLCAKDGVTGAIKDLWLLDCEEIALLHFPNRYALNQQHVWQVNDNFSQ